MIDISFYGSKHHPLTIVAESGPNLVTGERRIRVQLDDGKGALNVSLTVDQAEALVAKLASVVRPAVAA